jgi:cytoskeleton protein RodZ
MAETGDLTPADGIPFGEELRRQREIRGISLREIADSTKISGRFLEAIEKGDLKTLPAPAFTRGFIREYARYLGLVPDEIVDAYMAAVRRAEARERDEEPSADHPIRPPSMDRPLPAPAPRRRLPIAAIVVALAVIAFAVWFVLVRPRTALQRAAPEPAAESATTAAIPPPEPETSEPAPPPRPADDRLRMTLVASEDVWVTLHADGERVVNEVIEQGGRREIEARSELRFETIGNAGGISLTLNGIEVPQLGASGRVIRNRTFDRSSLEELRGTRPSPGRP